MSSNRDPGSSSKSRSSATVIGLGSAVVLVIVVALGAFLYLGGGDSEKRDDVADSASAVMRHVAESDSFAEWNSVICARYRGDVDSLVLADTLIGAGSGAGLGGGLNDDIPDTFTASDVTLDDGDDSAARVVGNGREFHFVKEGDRWLLCDPQFDLTQFNGIGSLKY